MKKILIAEDNELNMKLVSDILTVKGFEIDKAQDGEIALELLKRNKYDLFLLDLQMPKKDGFEILKIIQDKNIEIKTVVISALAMDKDIEKAKLFGCLDYITKPINVVKFLQTVETLTTN